MDNKDFRPPSPPDANISLDVLKDDQEMVHKSGSVYYTFANSHKRHMTTWPHPGANFIPWQVHMLETCLNSEISSENSLISCRNYSILR